MGEKRDYEARVTLTFSLTIDLMAESHDEAVQIAHDYAKKHMKLELIEREDVHVVVIDDTDITVDDTLEIDQYGEE